MYVKLQLFTIIRNFDFLSGPYNKLNLSGVFICVHVDVSSRACGELHVTGSFGLFNSISKLEQRFLDQTTCRCM